MVVDFNTRNKILTGKFLKQAIGITIIVKLFQNSVDGTMTRYINIMMDSNPFLSKASFGTQANFMET